jgi:phage shock protein C
MEPKRLYRSEKDKMIGGVCGGLAQYFNIDPTVVRLIFVLFLLLGGPGLLVYIIMWIVVPMDRGAVDVQVQASIPPSS